MKERRRFKRVPREHLVVFSCYHDGEEVPFDHSMGKTVNVGEGGLMLNLYKNIQKGTLLDVEIGLGDEVIDAKVEVLETRKNTSNGRGYLISARFVHVDHHEYQKFLSLEGLPPKKVGNLS